jgi:hypothetical protein
MRAVAAALVVTLISGCGDSFSSAGDGGAVDGTAPADGSSPSDARVEGSADGSATVDAGFDAGRCPRTPPNGPQCAPGTCYCASATTCYPGPVAIDCCGDAVICATSGGGSPDAGGCSFEHPLVDGGARFCAAGNCYCTWPSGESCYPAAVAATCCPSNVMTCY